MLKKKYRLISSSDFRTVYKNGVKVRGDLGMLIFLEDGGTDTTPKIGFVVGKKVGNAVRRHKNVRRLREIAKKFFKEKEDLIRGVKFSYVSFKYTEDFSKLEKELLGQFKYVVKRLQEKNK